MEISSLPMSLDDDDTPTTSLVPVPSADGEEALTADEVLEDETQDFRLFTKNAHISAQTIRKGEKDFESHGTRAQENALEQSRQAMTEVLSYTRVHSKQNWVRAWYFPDWWADWREEEHEVAKDGEKKPFAHVRDRVVLLEGSSIASMNLGRAVTGQPKDKPGRGLDWLLPEEALYLVERGSLDLWWPTRSMEELFPAATAPPRQDEAESESVAPSAKISGEDDEVDEYENGFPLSLQAAYSLLIGNDGDRGKISLQKFQVFSNLKRAGYNVLRAPPTDQQLTISQPHPPKSLWQWLSSLLSLQHKPQPYGPLVQPGLYRSYIPIYQKMAIIPRHKPSSEPSSPFEMEEPFAIHYFVWKAAQKWSKLRHPAPDFRLAVVDAQDSDVPTFEHVTALVGATPYNPANPDWKGPGRLYARLKHGHRHVLVAVVDHGVINYMRFAEGAFGEEVLYERFDARGAPRGGKGGGRGGGNRRGGRGGRGGRGRGRRGR
jgi:tRNA-splicing endonuclease subunit Sen54